MLNIGLKYASQDSRHAQFYVQQMNQEFSENEENYFGNKETHGRMDS